MLDADGAVHGDREQSSELPLRRACYSAFGIGAVVHAHTPWSTTLAVLRTPLPPVHYMLVLAGREVPVAQVYCQARAIGTTEPPPKRNSTGRSETGRVRPGRGASNEC